MLRAERGFLIRSEAPPPVPVGKLTPRDYQLGGITEARRLIAAGVTALLLVMATGGGKTVVAALVAHGAAQKRKRCLFMAPRREIVAQAFWKLVEAGVPELELGVIMADGVIPHAITRAPYNARRPGAAVQVASVQTLANRPLPPFDVVFVDEAHHATSPTWSKIIDHYRDAGAVVIGLTATPCRADGKGLGGSFKHLHIIASFRDLAEHPAGPFLVAPRVFTTPRQPDLSKVQINAKTGEYVQESAAAAMDRRELVGDVVEHYQRLAGGRRGVVFAASIEHSQHLAQAFVDAGIRAEHIDGETDRDERDAILAKLRAGETTVVCNYGVLCLDAETEILTSVGWVGIDGMTDDHEVANWSPDGVTFERPGEVVRRDRLPGERMVRVAGARADARVTEGHAMLYRTKRDGAFLKAPAREVVGRRVEVPVAGAAAPRVFVDDAAPTDTRRRARLLVKARYNLKALEGYAPDAAEAEAVRRVDRKLALRHRLPHELSADECRLIGFWIGDGSRAALKSGGVEYVITQSEAYPKIIAWLDGVLSRLGLDHVRKTVAPPTSGAPTPNASIRWSLARGTGGGSQERAGLFAIERYLDKDGSPLLWGLDEALFDALIEGLWLADGDHGAGEKTAAEGFLIHGTNRALLDTLQAIGAVRGYATAIRVGFNHAKNEAHRVDYILRLTKRSSLCMSRDRFELEEGWRAERVWCVRTRTKNIITRRGGKVMAMGNCEGWDEPGVAYIAIARPTKSLSLFLQMAGRGLRPAPGKADALLVDHAGCVHRHGLPQDDREWTLDGIVKRKGAVPVRPCPKCYAALPGGTAICTECGHEFPVEERDISEIEQVDGELVEASAKPKPTMADRTAFYATALAEAAARGRKLGFARHRYHEAFGIWPRGPKLKLLEREHYPEAASVEEPAPVEAAAVPELAEVPAAPIAPPVRARRIDLAALLGGESAPPPDAVAVEAWTL